MSKATISKDFRVIVEPSVSWYTRGKAISDPDFYVKVLTSDCQSIIEQIKRHVDDVESVYIERTQESVCEHCGYAWTEDSPHYNGGCCQADQNAEDARKAAQCADS